MKEKLLTLKYFLVSFIDKNQKLSVIIVIALITLILLIAGIASIIPKTGGNTSYNLQNGGYVASKGNSIYFVGYFGNEPDGIYKVSKSGNVTKKITNEYGQYMNIVGNKIYYLEDNKGAYKKNIVRIKTNGKGKKELITSVDTKPITVHDGWIYYAKNGSFYRAKTNGKKETKLSSKFLEHYQILGNSIYYTYFDNNDYVLAKMKTDGKDKNEIIERKAGADFHVKGSTIYYLKGEYGDRAVTLYKIKTDGSDKKEIGKIEGFVPKSVNMTDNGFYYETFVSQENSERAIFFVKYNGKREQIITVPSVSFLSIVGNYMVYFHINNNGEMAVYKVKTNGKDEVELN